MKKNTKKYEDDDGRTIADMSGVERQPLIIPRMPEKKKAHLSDDNGDEQNDAPDYSKEERRGLVLGAMSASALIALVFIVAGAIAIGLILLFVMR